VTTPGPVGRRPTAADVREHMDWWRKEAHDLRRDRLSRLQRAGYLLDQLLDAIEADDVRVLGGPDKEVMP
jgi:hypothetical protein